MTEFGATDDLPTLRRIARLSDDHMVGWLEWHYCTCSDPTTQAEGNDQALVKNPNKAPRGKNVKWRKLRVLERPYPQAIAGTPTGFGYRRHSHAFHLRYSTRAPGGGRLPRGVTTRVYVPRRDYPHGYHVATNGARVISSPNARRLVLRRLAGSQKITVRLTRPAAP